MPSVVVTNGFFEDDEYQAHLWSSRFCLILRGSSHTNSVRLYDAIMHGCVPAIVSDDFQPPLDRWLPWRKMALFLPTSQLPKVQHTLRREVQNGQWLRRFQSL